MALNDRFYEYFPDYSWSYYPPVQDAFFLRPSAPDPGGQIRNTYQDVDTETELAAVHNSLLTMKNDTRIVLGGAPTYANGYNYTLRYGAYNSQKWGALVEFAGDGSVDFANNTGASYQLSGGTTSDIQPLEKINLLTTNTVDTSYWARGSTAITYYGSFDASAYSFIASGKLTIQGNLNVNATVQCNNSEYGFYRDSSGKDPFNVDLASNNTANAAVFRAQSMEIENNFTGTLIATNGNTIFHVRKTASISGNTLSTSGFWTDNAFILNGFWGSDGTITATSANYSLYNDLTEMEVNDKGQVTGAKSASITGNTISAYGIRAGDITLNDVGKWVKDSTGKYKWIDGGSITTYVGGITIDANAISYDQDRPSVSISNNRFNSYAISGTSLTVKGYFEANLNASIGDHQLIYTGAGNPHPVSSNSIYLYGISLSGNLNAGSNFGGTITLNYSNDIANIYAGVNSISTSGIKANDISVNDGAFQTSITLDFVNMDTTTSGLVTATNMYGIYARNISTEALDVSITIDNYRSDGLLSAGINQGIYVTAGMGNKSDGVIDFTGDIDLYGGYHVVGISGGFDGFNIRVSGSISAAGGYGDNYAILAGTRLSTQISQTNKDDRVEIAAGAYILGDIDLSNGNNALIVDSNARVYGDLVSASGTLTVEYILNANSMSGTEATGSGAIVTARNALRSTVNVTVNLNNAAEGSYTLFDSGGSSMAAWQTRTVNFKYQGINQEMMSKLGLVIVNEGPGTLLEVTSRGLSGKISTQGGRSYVKDSAGNILFEVKCNLVGNKVVFDVVELPDNPVEAIAELTALKTDINRDKKTFTLNWADEDGSKAEYYEVEYRIVTLDANGNRVSVGNSVVRMLKDVKSTVVKGVEHNQIVEWRVRQNLGSGDMVSNWTQYDYDNPSGESVADNYVLEEVSNATFELGKSASNAVSELTWLPGESSEGIAYYEVEYFQSTTYNEAYMDPTSTAWNNTVSVLKQVSNSQILLSGLNNMEFFYWRVRVVDNNGNYSEWTAGELFKVYVDDNTPPTFNAEPEADQSWVMTDVPDGKECMDVTLSWTPAVDDRSGVARYTIRFRLKGGGEWTEIQVPVGAEGKDKYTFKLSDYIKENPKLGYTLLDNGTYEWELTATDYVGKETEPPLTGEWTADTTRPVFEESGVSKTESWNSSTSQLNFTVSWEPATDDYAVWGYELQYRLVANAGGAVAGEWITVTMRSDSANPYSWAQMLANGNYEYRVSAYDYAGNQSIVVDGMLYGDLDAPVLSASDVTVNSSYDVKTKESVFTFRWAEAQDDTTGKPSSGVLSYTVYYVNDLGETIKLGQTDKNGRELVVSSKDPSLGLSQSGIYDWYVIVEDAAGNKTRVDGSKQIIIDTTPPTGTFNEFFYTVTGTYTAEYIDDSGNSTQYTGLGMNADLVTQGEGTRKVVDYQDVSVTIEFRHNYTDDMSGLVFVIQISDTLTFNSSKTSNFTITNSTPVGDGSGDYISTLVLSDQNGYGVGAVAGMANVYWRVQALDALGNATGIWSAPQLGGLRLDSEDGYAIAYDIDKPSDITSTYSVVSGSNVVLSWSESYDLFGVKEYEIQYRRGNGTWVTEKISAENASLSISFNAATEEGTYKWKVRAVDYSGKTSAWSKEADFLVDVTDPVFNPNSALILTANGSKDVVFSWSAAFDANLAGYEIRIRDQYSGNVQVYTVSDPKALSYALTNMSQGQFAYQVRAYDSVGHYSHSWSEIQWQYFYVGEDPGDTMATAEQLNWGDERPNSVGGSDKKDFFKVTVDSSSLITITVSDVVSLISANSGVKVNIYNAAGKKIGSYTIKDKDGVKNLPTFIADAGTYYFEVVPGKSDKLASYSIEANREVLPNPTANNSYATAEVITLVPNGSSTRPAGEGGYDDGWVGYKDAADYYLVKGDAAGIASISIKGVDSKLKLSVYSVDVSGKLKKVKSVTIKGAGDYNNIISGINVASNFYVVVETTDKGKGKFMSDYDLSINNAYFPASSGNNSFTTAAAVNLSVDGKGSINNGWVGFMEAADYYVLDTAAAGIMNISVSGVEAKLKVSLWYQNAAGKMVQLKSVSLTNKFTSYTDIFKGVLVPKGEIYLKVESGDGGKGKQNSYYNVSINDSYFPAATNNNTFATADIYGWSSGTQVNVPGWVGYGDATNVYKFQASGTGVYTISLNGVNANTTYKVTIFDADGKKIKSYSVKYSDTSGGILFDKGTITGDFYVQVTSGDNGKGKQNGGYELRMMQNSVTPASSSAAAAQAFQANGDQDLSLLGQSGLSASDWVGDGDASDNFFFELGKTSRIDLDLENLAGNAALGKELSVVLYDENNREIKLDGNLTSLDELEAGKYRVEVAISDQKKYYSSYDLKIALA